MVTLRTSGFSANTFDPDLGLPAYRAALEAFSDGNWVLQTLTGSTIGFSIAGGAYSLTLRGRFNFSSEAALWQSLLTGFELSAGMQSISVGGLSMRVGNLDVLALISLRLPIGFTGSGYADLVSGDFGDDVLLGGGGDNSLAGAAGNDLLDGQSVQSDLLAGGRGNDTYVLGIAGEDPAQLSPDMVVEGENLGTDLIRSAYSLVLPQHLENLELTGSRDLDGAGNAAANRITGNAGANLLDGAGGSDTLAGGAGSDTYVLDAAGDMVQETVAGAVGGVDEVRAAVSHVLGLNVERLVLLAGGGAINGAGNGLANRIQGNESANRLDGGAGSDTLIGGDGDDTYVLDSIADVIEAEAADGGRDSVVAGRALVLGEGMFANIEDAELLGSGAFSLTGTAGANALRGNAGANTITGGQGDDLLDGRGGVDSLQGGEGADTYVIDSVLDRIADPDGELMVWSSVALNLGQSLPATPAWHAQVRTVVLQGVANLAVTGNMLANDLAGNAGSNTLVGGAGEDTLTGGAGNDLLDGGLGVDALAGGAGNDTYVVDEADDSLQELADAGIDVVRTLVSRTLPDHIEHLELQGLADLAGTGNALANRITGNAGANLLDGAGGVDTLAGGGGNDTYVLDAAGDVVQELVAGAAGGVDEVRASVSHVLGLNLERLVLAAGAGSINGTGNALANRMEGNESANRLDGGPGADTLVGGAGDDTYVLDGLGDVFEGELAGGGRDTVVAGRSLLLGAAGTPLEFIEDAELLGTGAFTLTGTDAANVLRGNAGANTLTGGLGDDLLDGRGGADSMEGGTGADTYVIDSPLDRIVDPDGDLEVWSGTSLVLSGTAGTTAWHAKVKQVVLQGTANLAVTGNALANELVGNAGNNTLVGGSGDDTLTGGAGNDQYGVDSAGDAVVELAGGGSDVVLTAVAYTLPEHVENLTLTTSVGALLEGNALANVITGNSGADTLDGLGGNDTLRGGAGDDRYRVESMGDVVQELLAGAAGGTDTVESTASFALGLNVERLVLAAGGGAINGTGNAQANLIEGNASANRLDGGAGSDTLVGGGGDDTFVLDGIRDVIEAEALDDSRDMVVAARSLVLGVGALAGIEDAELLGNGAFSLTGTGQANVLRGNAGANTIIGGEGGDLLEGRGGADLLDGGSGEDTYVIDSLLDRIVDPDGGLEVWSSISLALAGTTGATAWHTQVATVVLQGAANLAATGNALANDLRGNAGSNLLAGGNGNDTLSGGTGNDTYVVEDAGDVVEEAADQGVDLIRSPHFSRVLPDHVEHLELQGLGDLAGTGNALANRITGNAGANLLDGGEGNDTLVGGAGSDTYVIDAAGDVVQEQLAGAAGGMDEVRAGLSYVLGLNVERLVLLGSAPINGTGNALANRIEGNDSANRLDGGAGADTLVGGAGDDTYVLDAPGDVIEGEGVGGGRDRVVASRTLVLGEGMFADIEDAELLGVGAFSLTGTSGANELRGNAGANTITGGGGDDLLDGRGGADFMAGGAGRDTYVIDSTGDVVSDLDGPSVVWSSVNFDLSGSTAAVEELVLQGRAQIASGSIRAERIVGNELLNLVDGGDGDDTLLGMGGDDFLDGEVGDDSLDGGDGDDSLAGDDGNDVLEGGEGDDALGGGAGADTLRGGPGLDLLAGGPGDDRYENVDDDDLVLELPDSGFDRLVSTRSIELTGSLAVLESVELLGTEDLSVIGSATANVLLGNDGANLLDGQAGDDTLVGGNGEDSLLGAEGADRLEGGSGNDTLQGGDGADSLDGGAGTDSLVGGSGDDTYLFDATPGDVLVEQAGGGTDLVKLFVSLSLADLPNVESAALLGVSDADLTGTGEDNVLTGNAGVNALLGLAGNDTLSGGDGDDLLDGGTGVDRMDGGAGLDTFRVDSVLDEVIDSADNQGDVVETRVDYTLPSGTGVLRALGTTGLSLKGNLLANRLVGNAGNDGLEGLGGDTLEGGLGDDSYVLPGEFAVVTVVEAADAGIDTVLFASDVMSLAGQFSNIENAAVLPGSSYSTFKTLTGNAFANRLEGGAGSDVIDGGVGADTMIGGAGDDVYVVDDDGDVITELAGGGDFDTIRTDRSVVLSGAYAQIERVLLEGSTNASITGSAGNDRLGGNAGDNRIDGGGGEDTMFGGAGNDTFIVDSAGDTVTGGEAGVDVIESSVSYALGVTGDVEILRLTGAGNIDGSGTNLADLLEGNAGNNALNGGLGNDTLRGGGGNDSLTGGNGTDELFGDDGDDRFLTVFDGDTRVHGGTGTDILVFSGVGGFTLNLNGFVGSDQIYDGIEWVDLTGAGNNGLSGLFPTVVQELSDDGRLVVTGNANDFVTLVAGLWTEGAQQSIGTDLYRVFTADGASLWVDTDLTVL